MDIRTIAQEYRQVEQHCDVARALHREVRSEETKQAYGDLLRLLYQTGDMLLDTGFQLIQDDVAFLPVDQQQELAAIGDLTSAEIAEAKTRVQFRASFIELFLSI